ncbi:MAG TPA: DinB family protein [Thermoanaerobaculia bacterium]
MKSFRIPLIVLALPIALAMPRIAYAKGPQQNAAKPAAPLTGFRAEFFANLDDVQDKILDLAESTPADKFTWRPAPDVRSVSEVYMHIAGGNYFLATFLGIPAPRGAQDLEKTVTKKADVISELKRSFEHLRQAATRTEDLEKHVKMFGIPSTHRGVMVTMLSHLHEHLGQSIAYGRMNGVVPPWSR